MADMERINGIPTRVLGSTGERVTILCVGGYHIGKPNAREMGVRIIRAAIDEGINFLDNAWCYNSGESERIMGRALRDGYRDKVFLMTKNHGRDGETYTKQLEESLRRLQTDMIDLVQFHEIIDEGVPGRIFSEGAIDSALKAKEQGKIRYIGFTGHRWPHLHLEMLGHDFPWDTVQFPTNVLDAQFRSFTNRVLPVLNERGIGAIGMKSLAGGNIIDSGISAADALRFALSQPIDSLVSGIDSLEILATNLEIARNWTPMGEEEQQRLMDRTERSAGDLSIEHYKKPRAA
jgi:aryl-alcohol dehydrogenase-like predicted oxidoreductase